MHNIIYIMSKLQRSLYLRDRGLGDGLVIFILQIIKVCQTFVLLSPRILLRCPWTNQS